MATIEERARQYATKLVGGEYVGGYKGEVWLDLYTKYIEIATEQRKIDIEKVCEWLRENSETSDYQGLSSTCEMLFDTADDMIAYFRKAMEE